MPVGSGIAAGATAGAAFGPYGAAIGAVAGGVMGLAEGSGDGGAAGGPRNSALQNAIDARSFMDGSGWTVSTGSGKATGGDRRQSGPAFDADSVATRGFGSLAQGDIFGTPASAAQLGGVSMWALALGALVLVAVLRGKR